MTTATKIPDHGTQYRYKGARNGSWPPCRCDTCLHAHTKSCAKRTLAHLAGQPPLYPGAPIRQHIQTLQEAGMSYALIARRANVAKSTVSYLHRQLTQSCQRDKALRILAVTPGDFDAHAERPADGTTRRVRALYAIGHNHETVAAESGLHSATISHLANSRYRIVCGSTAAAVAAAYKTLSTRPGTSTKARARAAAEGWHGPLAWGSDIDNPHAQPDTADVPDPELKRDELAALRRDEIWLLATAGATDKEIARRVGVATSTVQGVRATLRTGTRRDRSKQVAA